ncbi:MAG: acyl-CoA thioesterase [Holophagales bacterium]|nr:acyl-CoA thioesterase [Holophagales bacterium]
MGRPFFEYRHVVGFEETNLVGNVYFANHLRWQGRCREMFLHAHCRDLLADLQQGLALITTRCDCRYFAELAPFDEVSVRMRLGEISQNRITMCFDYVRSSGDCEEIVARGEQEIACMRRQDAGMLPVPIPDSLRTALAPYSA